MIYGPDGSRAMARTSGNAADDDLAGDGFGRNGNKLGSDSIIFDKYIR